MSEVETNNLKAVLRQQESLRTIIESISSELELQPLLTRIVQHACELLAADRGTIGLVDTERHVIRTEAVYRMPAGELGSEMPPSVGLAGQVLQSQTPIILNQYGDLEEPVQPALLRDSVIGLPIFWHGRMIGFFGIGAEPPKQFGDQDVELLTQFARHAAIAIENARLFAAEKRRATRQTALTHIGKIIAGTLDLDELLQTAVNAIYDHLHYDDTGILLVSAENPDMLIMTACSGIYAQRLPVNYQQSIHEGIIGATARGRESILTTDAQNDPRYLTFEGAENIRSALGIPIITGERLLGVLHVESVDILDEEDLSMLEIVADQLGVAITNARLFEQTQRNLAEVQLLYETSRRIATALDVDDVIEAYLQHVAVHGRYVSTVALYEFDDAGQRTSLIVQGMWSPQNGLQLLQERVPYTRDALDPALEAGQTILISDVHNDPRVNETLRRLQKESGRPALAMIPLIVRRRRIGLVILSYPTVYQWSKSDLWPYQVTAAQLATAVDIRRQQLLVAEGSEVVAVLRERQRLARDLHDSVTQLIFSMTLIAQSIPPAYTRDPQEGEMRINRLLELSQNALSEMRALLFELRTSDSPPLPTETGVNMPVISRVQRDGLEAALQRHIKGVTRDGPEIQLDTGGYAEQGLEIEKALFRITQEALNNIVKHAQAARVDIRLYATKEAVRLQIRDDGVGFDLTAVPDTPTTAGHNQAGMGLRTMQERTEALNGRLTIHSEPGQGTTIQVNLPLQNGE